MESVSTIEPIDDRGSAVRFETQCVVIPDHAHHSRRPRVVTKSYTLPTLWKKRCSSSSPSALAPTEDVLAEENQSHLVLRVPLPTFSRKTHSTARSIDHTPLPSCLVHRAQPSSCSSTPSDLLPRHPRTSRKPFPSPSRSDIVTIPLRPCCAACQSVTDAAVVGGDAWPVQFSHAASRRRSASADGRPRTITVAGSTASASYGTLGVSISVDEIDKRRRSSDTGPSKATLETLFDDAETKEEYRVRRAAASSSSAIDARTSPSPTTPRIPEEEDDKDEDENELFPLPSPKRTPLTSPTPSPAGSLSSLTVAQTSPTHSTCSGDPHPSKRQFLAPPPCASSSSLSLPKFSESTPDLNPAEDPPRAPSPNLLSTLPTLSGRSPSPRISLVPCTPPDTFPSTTDSALPRVPRSLDFVPVQAAIPSSPTSSQVSTSPYPSPTYTRFPWRARRSVSADTPPPSCLPSSSPTLSTTSSSSNTRKPFLISNPRHIISDVLRGVGTMGSSSIGIGM